MVVIWGTHQTLVNLSGWIGSQDRDKGQLIFEKPQTDIRAVEENGVVFVKSEIIDDSTPSFRTTSRATVSRWADVGQVPDGWFGWKIMIPKDFKVLTKGFCSLIQLHADLGVFFALNYRKDDTFEIRSRLPNSSSEQTKYPVDLPPIKGRPFNVVAHLIPLIEGLLDIWIDGVKVLEHRGDMHSDGTRRVGASVIAGIYQALNNGNNYMLFKDAVCATTEQEVLDWLGAEDPEEPEEPEEPVDPLQPLIDLLTAFFEALNTEITKFLENLKAV